MSYSAHPHNFIRRFSDTVCKDDVNEYLLHARTIGGIFSTQMYVKFDNWWCYINVHCGAIPICTLHILINGLVDYLFYITYVPHFWWKSSHDITRQDFDNFFLFRSIFADTECVQQYWGSVTFWCGYGSGSGSKSGSYPQYCQHLSLSPAMIWTLFVT